MMPNTSKKIEILDLAQELMQKRGYNGFSYADIADAVGIRKASVHHHFASKEELALAVVHRYQKNFLAALRAIAMHDTNWLEMLREYGQLYKAVLNEKKLCLCGMLASDIETLPKSIQEAIKDFFEENAKWVTKIISRHHKMSPKKLNGLSWQIISSLQGAVLIAKLLNKPDLFAAASRELFLTLAAL